MRGVVRTIVGLVFVLAAVGCGHKTTIDPGNGPTDDAGCSAICWGKECGNDGCGGSCGECYNGLFCYQGACVDEVPPGEDIGDAGSFPGDALEPGTDAIIAPPGVDTYQLPDIEDPTADTDNDGLLDGEDNCPFDYNPSQLNFDGDAGGDACDPDDDNDGDSDEVDCEPKNPEVSTWATEICDDIDNNCNFQIDEEGAIGCIPYYQDQDMDGFGVFETTKCLCAATDTWTSIKWGDCADTDPNLSPGATEVCDDKDNDCDGVQDEGCDEDGDGFCNIHIETIGFPTICPFGPGDCYDGSPAVNPGALEDPGDGVDNDCDGEIDEAMVCPGQCTGHTVDAYLCALEMCFGPLIQSANFSSPSGANTDPAWQAVNHFGNAGNDLAPWAGVSYGLLAAGQATGTSHSGGLGGTSIPDPYASDGYPTYDNIEFKVVMTAPANAIGFSIDYIFFSEEYEEYIGSSFNDKFYIFLKAPQTTGNQKIVTNYTNCSNPNAYFDFQENGQKWCYIAINTAFSEPCSNVQTNISGTGYECGPGGSTNGSSTGWLVTQWPIQGGETFELTFHIHDSSDAIYDSEVILDNFHWLSEPFDPGTASHD